VKRYLEPFQVQAFSDILRFEKSTSKAPPQKDGGGAGELSFPALSCLLLPLPSLPAVQPLPMDSGRARIVASELARERGCPGWIDWKERGVA
jgi:hypothetical protein